MVEILKIFSSAYSGPSVHMNVLLCFVTQSCPGKGGHELLRHFLPTPMVLINHLMLPAFCTVPLKL